MHPATNLPSNWRALDWAVNVYTCQSCGKHTTTVDVDLGVTPFMIQCPHCKDHAQSACYPKARPIPQWVPAPTHEWYRPEPGTYNPINEPHVSKGGLLMREWTGKTPIVRPFRDLVGSEHVKKVEPAKSEDGSIKTLDLIALVKDLLKDPNGQEAAAALIEQQLAKKFDNTFVGGLYEVIKENPRTEVLLFAVLMERRLKLDHVGEDWKNDPSWVHYRQMKQAVEGLRESIMALGEWDVGKIAAYAASIANSAMMIAAVLNALPAVERPE